MRSVLYSTTRERAESVARVLGEAGHGPELRILEAGKPTESDVAASRGCGIVVVDLELGTGRAVALCAAIRANPGAVPTVLAILGDPDPADVDALVAAGADLSVPHAPQAFASRTRLLRGLEPQLMAVDRLASLGRIAASVGHEINNPLTYVIGNLQLATHMLRKAGGASGELLQMLAEALEGADRVQRMVEDLRVFSQRQHDARRAVDVRAVLDACVRVTAGELRYRARMIQVIEDIPPVLASEARLAQVITNLLLNAAQAMSDRQPEPGTISIAARELPGQRVEIRIEDTGSGIAPEHLAHVFEPFFTTKAERGGTGLGLAICRMIVTSHGGELALESTPGEGTRVTLILPAAARDAVTSTPA